MPSTIQPTSIGSSGKAATRTVPTTALRSGSGSSFTGTSAGLVVHDGSGLTDVAITPTQNGGAGAGAETVETKIANLDISVRRRRVLTAVLAPTGVQGDFVGKDGLQAILNDSTDPVTGSVMTNGGTIFMRWGTYTLDDTPPWIARIGIIGEERGRNAAPSQVSRPIININQAADYLPSGSSSNGGFHKVENVTLSSLSTGRWRIGRTVFGTPVLESADNVLFDSCLYSDGSVSAGFFRAITIANSFFIPKGGCLVTSNYNLDILNGTHTFENCRFEGISPAAADPTLGAVVHISGNGNILFDRCEFANVGDEAIVELVNSTATVVFRNCNFTSNTTVSATARPAFVASNGYGVTFENCTMVSKGRVFAFSEFGGVIDGFKILESTGGSVLQADPVLYSFQGNNNAYIADEHAWMDIRNMEVRVGNDSLAAQVNSPTFLVSDYVKGGKILIAARSANSLGAGSFFKIDRTTSSSNEIAVFDEVTIDCAGETSPTTVNALVSLSGCATSIFENTPQVHIGNLNVINIGNTADRTYVEIVRAVKVANLTLEGTTSVDNAAPFLTFPGNNVIVDRLAIDSNGGSSTGLRSGATAINGIVHITGERVSINGGFYYKGTTIGDNTNSIFRIEGDYATLREFNLILDHTVTMADAVIYVRADHFTQKDCFIYGSTMSSAVRLWDIDGSVVQLQGNILKSATSGPIYGNLAGSVYSVIGNHFVTAGLTAPSLNVTATNVVPVALSDSNVFAASVPAGAPIT